jgi:hypothetical protein
MSVEETSHPQRTLALLEKVLEGRAGSEEQSYQIGGRRLDKTPIAELIQLHKYYTSLVNKEKMEKQRSQGINPYCIVTQVDGGY